MLAQFDQLSWMGDAGSYTETRRRRITFRVRPSAFLPA